MKIIKTINQFLSEGYPAGAEYDPRAPWNQSDDDLEYPDKPEQPKSGIPFEVIAMDNEIALSRNKNSKKDLYVSYLEDEYFEEYKPKYRDSYGDWEYEDNDEYSIEAALYDIEKSDIGDGLEDWENGESIAVKIDPELAGDLIDSLNSFINREESKTASFFKKENIKKTTKIVDEIEKEFPNAGSISYETGIPLPK